MCYRCNYRIDIHGKGYLGKEVCIGGNTSDDLRKKTEKLDSYILKHRYDDDFIVNMVKSEWKFMKQ